MNDTEKYTEAKKIADTLSQAIIENKSIPNDNELSKWIEDDPNGLTLLSNLADENFLKSKSDELETIEQNKADDINRFFLKIAHKKRRSLMIISSTLSAAVLVTISFLIFSPEDNNLSSNSNRQKKYVAVTTLPKVAIKKPTLILSNGENMDLTATKVNIETARKEGNKLVYSQNNKGDNTEIVKYNTLILPNRLTYAIMLEDGTEVLLNANSELRYPIKFVGNKREVYLKGEAFFNVKKGDTPFIVNCSNVGIKVYGTQFNVKADNLTNVQTVLISGSVGVSFNDPHLPKKEVLISPGEMIISDLKSSKSTVEQVDCNQYIAWTTGYFRYDSNKLYDVFEELSMWYGVEFYFENHSKSDLILTASFEKESNLEEILEALKIAINIDIRKEGGKYIIK